MQAALGNGDPRSPNPVGAEHGDPLAVTAGGREVGVASLLGPPGSVLDQLVLVQQHLTVALRRAEARGSVPMIEVWNAH